MSAGTTTHAPPRAAAAGPADAGALLASAVRHAVRAPSGHNTQPWRFVLRGPSADADGPTLELYADRTRALPVVDPVDRALVASCGAALGFLRVALRAAGVEPHVARLPDAGRPDLLARIRAGAPRVPTGEDVARLGAIAGRHTTRRPFDPTAVPDALLAGLVATARAERVRAHVVATPDARAAVADLVAEGDRRQAADPAFRRELAAWIRANRSPARDGMPGAAHGMGDVASLAGAWVIRTLDWGDRQAARDRALVAATPALVVLATDDDAPAAWLRTGEALGLLLLDATAAGLAASFLNQPIEVAALRPALARTLGVPGFPQLLLRLGYGPPAPATPRRRIDEVLEDRRSAV